MKNNTFSYLESKFDKRISYILVTKDRPEYLEKVIRMLSHMKKGNDEVILINGGSVEKIKSIGFKTTIDLNQGIVELCRIKESASGNFSSI